MSTALYPLGMKPNNKQGGYVSWKGGNGNPVGNIAGNIRPFTNKDYTNNAPMKFGLPRPIKHYRKGRAFNEQIIINNEVAYINRNVRSCKSLLFVQTLMDYPGCVNVFNQN